MMEHEIARHMLDDAIYPPLVKFPVAVAAIHIALGVKESCLQCPLAIAIREAWPRSAPRMWSQSGVMVQREHVTAWVDGFELYAGKLPPEETEFIDRFDAGQLQLLEPHTFDLELHRVDLGESAQKMMQTLRGQLLGEGA